jgi:hypothetical protein
MDVGLIIIFVMPLVLIGWLEWSSRRDHAWRLDRDDAYLARLRAMLTEVAAQDSKTAYTQALGTAMAESVRSVQERK